MTFPLLVPEEYIAVSFQNFLAYFASSILLVISIVNLASYYNDRNTRMGRENIQVHLLFLISSFLLFLFGAWFVMFVLILIAIGFLIQAFLSVYSLTKPLE